MMKLLSTLILLIAFSSRLNGQYHLVDIPEMKNLNPEDKYPERSMLATYTTNFDILISLNNYSAWGPDDHIKTLAHHKSGWYKIEINRQPGFDPYTVCYSTIKIKDAIGDTIWSILTTNHLFEIKDDRTTKTDCSSTIFDGPEYEFEILTANKYKKIYSYSPRFFEERCPMLAERKLIINCINVFEKYLGN